MERNASATNLLSFALPSTDRRSVVRTCGSFTIRCLQAVAESYLQSTLYNPYWIGVGPLPESRGNEAHKG